MSYQHIQVERLSGGCGAVISGIDLSEEIDEQRRAVAARKPDFAGERLQLPFDERRALELRQRLLQSRLRFKLFYFGLHFCNPFFSRIFFLLGRFCFCGLRFGFTFFLLFFLFRV